MGQIKWYKRDPEAALNGMMMLSLEERGAYNTVLDLFYLRDGNLPDDDRFIAGHLGVDLRVWRRIKTRLIDLQKLSIRAGRIHNDKADEVLLEALRRVTSARDAGKASARSKVDKNAGENNENNDIGVTPVETDVPTDDPTIKNKSKIEDTDVSSPPTPEHTSGKGWPEIPDWVPVEPWNGFIEMRRQKKAFPTPRAVKMLINTLDDIRKSGCDPGAELDRSTVNNWTAIYLPKDSRNDRPSQSSRRRGSETDLYTDLVHHGAGFDHPAFDAETIE